MTNPDARHVSRVLAKGGLTRSSRYSIWGYETEGFIVNTGHDGTVTILWSLKGDNARTAALDAERILTDAGFTTERVGRWDHPTQPSSNLKVTR